MCFLKHLYFENQDVFIYTSSYVYSLKEKSYLFFLKSATSFCMYEIQVAVVLSLPS